MQGKWLVMCCLLCCFCICSLAQEEAPKLPPLKLLQALDKQYQKANERLQKQTKKYLQKLQKQEQKLKQQLAKTDSLKAAQVFGNIDEKYEEFAAVMHQKNNELKQYLKNNDSVATALKYLSLTPTPASSAFQASSPKGEEKRKLTDFGEGSKTLNYLASLKEGSTKIPPLGGLGGSLQNAGNLKQQLKQRKDYLKQQLQNTP